VNIDVTVEGRPWNVTVEPTDAPGRFAITIKGTRRVVDASWIDADTLSLVDGTTVRDVRIHRRSDGRVGVEVGGRVYDAALSMSAKRDRADAKRGRMQFSDTAAGKIAPAPFSGAPPDATSVAVKAPMPGRVVRVLVAVGERVSARQGVVVVEAMKMENELRTPREGTVKEIAVVPGAAVESGAVLLVIGDS
jgi:pyruvate carboxylase subunit B